MLNKPTLSELMQNVDSKYTLVIVAAKRARAMIDKNPELASMPGVNPVSIALNEVADGTLHWSNAAQPAQPEETQPEQQQDMVDLSAEGWTC